MKYKMFCKFLSFSENSYLVIYKVQQSENKMLKFVDTVVFGSPLPFHNECA